MSQDKDMSPKRTGIYATLGPVETPAMRFELVDIDSVYARVGGWAEVLWVGTLPREDEGPILVRVAAFLQETSDGLVFDHAVVSWTEMTVIDDTTASRVWYEAICLRERELWGTVKVRTDAWFDQGPQDRKARWRSTLLRLSEGRRGTIRHLRGLHALVGQGDRTFEELGRRRYDLTNLQEIA